MSDAGMTPGPSEHGPAPTIWPLGFAVGIAVGLVGLIIDPEVIGSLGGVIAIVFGFMWARAATGDMRAHVPVVQAEVREATPAEIAAAPSAMEGEAAMPVTPAGQKMPRSRFLEGATLGLGGLIGAIVTVPVAGVALLPPFLRQKGHKVDLGPLSAFPEGKWFITTFIVNPSEGAVDRRTAFIRNNGTLNNVPSFTIISNRCSHLGCPTQANGPTGAILGQKNVTEHTANGKILLRPVVPAGFGCPCHGSQFDVEGNRTAGPAVRALDRYSFEIDNGHLVLLSTYSVSHVVGTGAQAKIYKYKLAGPGQHVDGPEQWFYPLQPPHH
ncbi:MAG: Rieske 2Fe-2S domain-containing protein [Actinobacteria bacterium]|nr:Rieske 2Fe-2S domain-containing protein [Actinomycetota bacterium]MBV8478908.1 Rieske 2Fe-2S domain-containing protein [Actinomycetota bacterium]